MYGTKMNDAKKNCFVRQQQANRKQNLYTYILIFSETFSSEIQFDDQKKNFLRKNSK